MRGLRQVGPSLGGSVYPGGCVSLLRTLLGAVRRDHRGVRKRDGEKRQGSVPLLRYRRPVCPAGGSVEPTRGLLQLLPVVEISMDLAAVLWIGSENPTPYTLS